MENKYEQAMIRIGLDFNDKDLMDMFNDEAKQDVNLLKNACKITDKIESYLNRWYELLKTDGINSKLMVANDIQALLKELE